MIFDAEDITITKVERDSEGHWIARVHCKGMSWNCHKKYGSWQTTCEGRHQTVFPEVAAKLQRKVKALEKAERKAAESIERGLAQAARGELGDGPEHPPFTQEHDEEGKQEAKEMIAEGAAEP